MHPLLNLSRQWGEGVTLASARIIYGDEQVAEWVFDQDYNPEFVGRHTRQLSSLYEAKYVPDDIEVDGDE